MIRNVYCRIVYNITITEDDHPIKIGEMVKLWYIYFMEYYTAMRKKRQS